MVLLNAIENVTISGGGASQILDSLATQRSSHGDEVDGPIPVARAAAKAKRGYHGHHRTDNRSAHRDPASRSRSEWPGHVGVQLFLRWPNRSVSGLHSDAEAWAEAKVVVVCDGEHAIKQVFRAFRLKV